MASIDVHELSWSLPGGGELLRDVSFRVGDGNHVALVGANGVGKTTLVRLLAGDDPSYSGRIKVTGRLGVMRQFIGSVSDDSTVRQLMVSLAPSVAREAAATLGRAAAATERTANQESGVRYAHALAAWEEAGGYDLEVFWDACLTRALGAGLGDVGDRPVSTLSGGEQKQVVLEVLLTSQYDVLLLDEPDNYLDIPAKEWLARELNASDKTILFVSHDRELLANAAHKLVTLEARGAWTHGGSFETWQTERVSRQERLADEHVRWEAERKRLRDHMRIMKQRAATNDTNAGRARAAESRLRRFEAAGPPPELAHVQTITMDLGGSRTGKLVVTTEQLELVDLTFPFDTEIHYGDRVGVVGRNGTGKSHFVRLLAGEAVAHEGAWKLGARVEPGRFAQTHDQPQFVGRTLRAILSGEGLDRGQAMATLSRYELQGCAEQTWETLSGGQQARFQILLLEVGGATLLLLDEPTDNLDVASAEALESALATYDGTVIAVTHDRWFLRALDRFLVFQEDGEVIEATEPEQAWAG